jgi:PAS domain S-box-containing protein
LLIRRRILKSLKNNNPEVIINYINDSSRTIKYSSKNIFTLTGYLPNDFINNKNISLNKLIHPDDQFAALKAIQYCNPKNRSYKAEYRILTKDKQEKWILEQGICYFDKNEKIINLEGILTDISDQKFNEDILKESEHRFQLLIENAPMGICISYNNLITYGNPIFIKMMGFSEQMEILGLNLLQYIKAADKQKQNELIEFYKSNSNSGTGLEAMAKRKDGTLFPVQIYLTKVNLDYEVTLTFILDITEQKQSIDNLLSLNQRLNDIIELIPDPTFIIDKNKKVIHWNKAIEELTGIKKEEMLGKDNSHYSIPIYRKQAPMLIDLIDGDINTFKNTQAEIKKDIKLVNNKIYGNFYGEFFDKKTCYLWGVAAPLLDCSGNRFGAIEVIKDITEAKQKEKALIKSEMKSRMILDINQDIILLIKSDNSLIDCNLSFIQMTGKPKEELIGKKIPLSCDPESVLKYQQLVNKAIETGENQLVDCININLEYYSLRIYPIKDENKTIRSLVVYIQNTTKLKNAEKALRDSEEEYRTITESITDYLYKVILKNEKIFFLFKNPGIEKILGYQISEFKTNPDLFFDLIVAEDMEIFHSKLNQAIKNRENVTFEHRVTHKNGSHIWLSNSLILKEPSKNSLEFNGVIKDISLRKHFEIALKKAEERYRLVFDQSGLSSIVYDLEGMLIMQNTVAAKLLGGIPSDFIGKNIEEIYSAETSRIIKSTLTQTIEEDGVVIYNEREFILPTGKYWLKTASHSIKNPNGKVIGVQFISQDITEKKVLDRKILNTIIETEEKERMHFAQELHDGLGPIISAVKMYIQWLSRPDSKVSQKEILMDTENLINDAGETIREISFKLSPHILNNFGLMEALKAFTEKVNPSKKLEILLDYNFTTRFERTIETVIYRILCECINNTIKHANATRINIKVLKFITKTKITYTDNGIGFDMSQMSNQKKGNGLLNMQSRLQSINGSLIIKSQPGKGIKIMISIRL